MFAVKNHNEMSTAALAKNEMAPSVATAGMKPGDAEVDVVPKAGGGYTLSPLPVGGRRRKSRKGGKSRRRGGADEPMAAPAAPAAMGARRRKSRKTKKAGRRH